MPFLEGFVVPFKKESGDGEGKKGGGGGTKGGGGGE